jgi:hypothetical protein
LTEAAGNWAHPEANTEPAATTASNSARMSGGTRTMRIGGPQTRGWMRVWSDATPLVRTVPVGAAQR